VFGDRFVGRFPWRGNDVSGRIGSSRTQPSAHEYEAWVIAWPSGTGLAMHDHDGSRAAVAVVDGALRERFKSNAGTHVRWLEVGDVHVLPHDHVHEVINLGADEAISVHVYSPPIANLGFRIDPEIDLRADRSDG
jgi:predicted metal-dependent enzyme (double-stranded beta helix superfamily)